MAGRVPLTNKWPYPKYIPAALCNRYTRGFDLETMTMKNKCI